MPFRVLDRVTQEVLISCEKVQTLIDYIDREEDWNVKMMDVMGTDDEH